MQALQSRFSARVRWLLIGGLLGIAGCGVLPGKSSQQPVIDYSLNAGLPPGASDAGSARADSCLDARVMLPRSAAGFNTSRMAYMEDSDSLRYFAYSQWLDTPAYMIQPLLVMALKRSGRFQTVVRSPSPVRTRFHLVSDDLALVQQLQDGQSTMRLALRVQLVDARESKILLDKPMVLTRATAANARQGVATANALAAELIERLAANVAEALDVNAYCSDPG